MSAQAVEDRLKRRSEIRHVRGLIWKVARRSLYLMPMARLGFHQWSTPPSLAHYETHNVGQSPFSQFHFHTSVCCCGFLWLTPCCEAPLIQLCRREIVCLFGNRPGFVYFFVLCVCVCVCSEVAGSGRRIKRYTRVRNEVLSLYGNGVHCTVCWRGLGDTELWRSGLLGTYLSLCQFNVSMSMRVGGFFKIDVENDFLFRAFRGCWREPTQDPAFLQYPVHMSSFFFTHWTHLITLKTATDWGLDSLVTRKSSCSHLQLFQL